MLRIPSGSPNVVKRSPPVEQQNVNDEAVQATNDEAATVKLSSVRLGYFEDEGLELLLGSVELPFRSPLMLRGYYSRVSAIRLLISKFLHKCQTKGFNEQQIVLLGAGFDMLYFHLLKHKHLKEGTRFYEIDFPSVMREKIRLLTSNSALLQLLQTSPSPSPHGGDDCDDNSTSPQCSSPSILSFDIEKPELHTSQYHLIASDLRDLPHFTERLNSNSFRSDVPTLFLSECVLIYLDPSHSVQIIEWAQRALDLSFFITYEQIKPHDPFGQVMVQNLEIRGCPLKSLMKYPDEQSQIHRFLSAGWQSAQCKNMNYIYSHFLDKSDKQRIEKLQIFDEFEEWHLMHDHYCITWARNAKNNNLTLWSKPPF